MIKLSLNWIQRIGLVFSLLLIHFSTSGQPPEQQSENVLIQRDIAVWCLGQNAKVNFLNERLLVRDSIIHLQNNIVEEKKIQVASLERDNLEYKNQVSVLQAGHLIKDNYNLKLEETNKGLTKQNRVLKVVVIGLSILSGKLILFN